jgi:hypothetical protein
MCSANYCSNWRKGLANYFSSGAHKYRGSIAA